MMPNSKREDPGGAYMAPLLQKRCCKNRHSLQKRNSFVAKTDNNRGYCCKNRQLSVAKTSTSCAKTDIQQNANQGQNFWFLLSDSHPPNTSTL
jgi:hypothetical protein